MKKKIFLLPIALLLLGGCSNADLPDGSSGSLPPISIETIEDAIAIIKSTSDYKCRYSFEVSQEGSFTLLYPAVVPATLTEYVSGLAKIHGESSGQNTNDGGMLEGYQMKISDLVSATGQSVEQLEEMIENPEYAQYIVEYHIDKEHDSFDFKMKNTMGDYPPNTDIYVDKKEGESQFRYANFCKGKLVESQYFLDGQNTTETSTIIPLVNRFKDESEKITVKDGKYVIDLTEEPLDLGYSEIITKFMFSYTKTSAIIECEGHIGLLNRNLYARYEMFDFGNSQLTIPQYEVFCPFNHECTYYSYADANHHRLTCRYCDKYLSSELVEHTRDSNHGICKVCETNGRPITENTQYKYLADGSVYMMYTVGYNDLIYDCYFNDSVKTYGTYNYLEDIEKHAQYSYYANDEILGVTYNTDVTDSITSCCRYHQNVSIVFDHVSVELTPEQESALEQAIATHNYDVINAIYNSVLVIPDTLAELKSLYGNGTAYVWYNYEEMHVEDYPVHSVHPEGTCWYGSYTTCADCGEVVDYHGGYRHHYDVHAITTPEWAKNPSLALCQIGTCSECGDVENSIYGFYKSQYHELYNYGYVYDEQGNELYQLYNYIPHTDENDDHLCDFCGAQCLSVTHEGVTYSLYINNGSVVSSTDYWTPNGTIDPGDADWAYSYRNRQNDQIYCNVYTYLNKEENSYHYKMVIGDDVYVSPEYPMGS